MSQDLSNTSEAPSRSLALWRVPLLVLVACLLLGHAPLAVMHFRGLWQHEQYQYFPFVLGAFAWLLYSRWQAAPENTVEPRWPAAPWFLLGFSLLLLIGAILLFWEWLAFVSLTIALAGVFVWLGRQRKITNLWGIWLLLWLMIPAPAGIDSLFIVLLQRVSSHLSSSILDVIGIQHVMTGNVLNLVDKQLFVDEACSGIISVMSVVACAMIYAVWKNRSFLHLFTLMFLGVVWAVILNVVRICVIAVADDRFGTDLSSGTPHEILGLVLFCVTFLALVSTDMLLAVMMAPINRRRTTTHREKNGLVRIWNRVFAPRDTTPNAKREEDGSRPPDGGQPLILSRAVAAGAAFLVLGLIQLVWIPSTDTAQARAAVKRAAALDEEFLPATIGPWVQESFETVEREKRDRLGHYSKMYTYRHSAHPDLFATVSLDFAYVGGWHDLCMCYRGGGWRASQRVVESKDPVTHQDDWQYVEADLKRPDGAHAMLVFAGFDVSGAPARPPSKMVLFHPWFYLRQRLLLYVAPQLFQVQVFTTGDDTDDEAVREDIRQLLLDVRSRFRDHVTGEPKVADRSAGR